MRKRQMCGLVALNLTLLAGLAMVTFGPVARAQQEGGGRAAGDYTMVSGNVQGLTEEAIYIVDAINNDVVALRWDSSRKSWEGLGHSSLDRAAGAGGQRGR